MRRARPILAAVSVVYLSELLLELPIELGHVAWFVIPFTPIAFPLGCLFVACVLTTFYGLTGKLTMAAILTVGLGLVVTIADAVKLSILGEPVYPTDVIWLSEPGFLVEMVSPRVLVAGGVLAVALVGTVAWWLVVSLRRTRSHRPSVRRRVTRLVALCLGATALWQATEFHHPNNLWDAAYEASGASWKPWSQSLNYRDNGFVGGALFNMPIDAMPKPSGYSRAAIDEIAQKYAVRAAARNAGTSPDALAKTNVVVVLSEGFGDPGSLKGIRLAEDPIPNVRSLIQSGWGGTTVANFHGIGTSTMEWQALSGEYLGLFNPQISTPYAMVIPKLKNYPTAVGWFQQHGHRAVAVHPYFPSMYRRRAVYDRFGFDDFIYESKMKHTETVEDNDFVSDKAAYEEVLDQIDSSSKPLLVNLVTMQNHYPVTGKYDDPIPSSGDFDKAYGKQVSAYARGLSYSDEAIAGFLDQLKKRDEPTIVVYYGDHYPAVLSDQVIEENPGTLHRRTPMFVWTSTGAEQHRALNAASPSTFLPLVFQLAGQSIPAYYELIDELAEKVGTIAPGVIVRPDGTETAEDQLTPEQEELVHDMKMVEYDFSIGHRYGVSSMWYQFPEGRG
ncbi:LTA synthase family protein [Nocardioides terrae]|uniref:LTA synthase family protein n=1 Tax=Nocardioides terrae TaxID=574651 RepID=UPI0015874A9A|nr:LTA synthase family protein [Nocardioides terrae]